MALRKGYSRQSVSHNIRKALEEGKSHEQAVAIALDVAREAAKKAEKPAKAPPKK